MHFGEHTQMLIEPDTLHAIGHMKIKPSVITALIPDAPLLILWISCIATIKFPML
jgi:hypothetical protein